MPEILTNITFPGSQTVDGVDISAHVADVTTLHLPNQATHSGKFLTTNGSVASWATLTGGDVVGPSSSTDNAIARFDLATGKLLQNSVVTVDDSGSINIPTGQSYKINGTALTAANVGAAATSHAHGNVTTDGKIGTTATLPIITGTGGVLQAGSFGTGAGTFCQGNDSRLSDARTPTAHTHGNITNTGYIGTTATLPIITGTGGILQAGSFGTGAGTFCQGNDARLSDARTPTAHVLNSASHTVSGLTTGHFLMATGATTFAFQAHTSHSTLTISAPLSGTSYNGSAAVSIGLAAAYGDTTNPYASKTAKYFLAAPNAAAGVPSFRAIVASDIPSHTHTTNDITSAEHTNSRGGGPSTGSSTGTSWTATAASGKTFTATAGGTYQINFTGSMYAYRSELGQIHVYLRTSTSGTYLAEAMSTESDAVGADYIVATGSVAVNLAAGTVIQLWYEYRRGSHNATSAEKWQLSSVKICD